MTEQSPRWPAADTSARKSKIFEAQVQSTADRIKADHDAQIAAGQATADTYNSWATANRAADVENLQKFFDGMSTLALGSVDRARAAAEVVQKASAAIAALYTGVLALVFSVTENPLPARGVVSPFFLGLAVVLSTAYLAYINPIKGYSTGPQPVLGLEPKTFQRLNAMIEAASKLATRRSWCLRASVVALGFGLAYIVLPFVSFASTTGISGPASVATPWPTPDPSVSDVELNKILYSAQVKEVADARASSKAPVDQHDGAVLLAATLIGLVGVVFVPVLARPGS